MLGETVPSGAQIRVLLLHTYVLIQKNLVYPLTLTLNYLFYVYVQYVILWIDTTHVVHSLQSIINQTGEEAAQLRFVSFYFLLSLFSLFSSLSLLAVNFSDVGLGVFVPMARGVLGVNPPE